ncbi:Ig-like domain-containing protein [Acinetobacter sp. WCHAc060025]|uniref:Ig-like domain-containing protein n=1 Tax=Acinetobacter sp. WCHAc060025 TaxID=2518625 RepID=UPI001BC88686|nr:Ig-like domain-containing protein [Acinetobacter sp. WCHAc060025]
MSTPSTDFTADTIAPVFQSAEVNTAGAIVLHYDEILDIANPPLANQFTVTVGGVAVDPSKITVSIVGNDVILSLVPAVKSGQSVSVSYTDQNSAQNDTNTIQDVASNDADNLINHEIDLTDNHSTMNDLKILTVYDYVDQVSETLLTTPETINLNGFSNEASPTIIGKANAGEKVTITIQGYIYEVDADSNGVWTLDLRAQSPTVVLSNGLVNISVTNGTTTVTFEYTVDTQLASPTLELAENSGSGADLITNNGQINVSNIEADAIWNYQIKGGQWEPGQGTSFTLKDDGDYTIGDIKVQVIDRAGNIVEVIYDKALTLDTNPPLPLTAVLLEDTAINNDGITSNGTLEITGIEQDAKVYINVKGAGWIEVEAEVGTGLFKYLLSEVVYAVGDIQLKQVDVAGNESVITDLKAIEVDQTVAPVTVRLEDTGAIESTGTVITKNPIITISNVETGAKLYYTKDTGTAVEITTKDSLGNYILVLPAGNYSANTFNFYQVDVAGNTSTLTTLSNFVIDTTVEPVVITNLLDNTNSSANVSSGALINKNDFTLTGTAEVDSNVDIYINGVKVNTTPVKTGSDGQWAFDFGNANPALTNFFENGVLKDGNYTITAKSTDLAGNISNSSDGYLVSVDTVIQAPTLDKVTGDDSISSAEYLSGIKLSGTAEAGSTVYVEWRNTVSKDGTLLNPNISASFISDTQIKVTSDSAGDKVSIVVNGKLYEVTLDSSKTATITLDQAYTGNVDVKVTHTFITDYITTVTISNLDFTTTADANGKWSLPITGLPTIPDQASNAHISVSSEDQAGNTSSSVDRTVPILRNESGTINVIAGDDKINKAEWDSYTTASPFTVSGNKTDSLEKLDYLYFKKVVGYNPDGTAITEVVYSSPSVPLSVDILLSNYTGDNWQVSLQSVLSKLGEGTYRVELRDSITSTSTLLAYRDFLIDTIVPSAPVITELLDYVDSFGNIKSNPESITELPLTDKYYTNDSSPVINGTGSEVGSIITVLIKDLAGNIIEKSYASVNENLQWTYDINKSIDDGDYKVEVFETDKVGNISQTTTIDLVIDTVAPDFTVNLVANDPTTGAIEIDLKEISDGVEVKGHVDQVSTTITVEINGKSVTAVVDANGNWTAKFTSADLIGLNDGTDYPVKITAVDLAGNQSETTLNAHTKFGHSVELKESDYAGTALVVETDLAVANTTLKLPTAAIQVKGQNVVWSLENGVAVGKVGNEVVIQVRANANGKYEVVLSQGIDHIGSDIATIQIPVETNGVNSQLSIVVHDGEPVVSPVVNIDMTEAGTVTGTFVNSFGMDGGYLKSVTIEGNTYIYNSVTNTVTQSGTSKTVYAYSYSNDENHMLTVTTVHGNTVKVNMQTGEYEVSASGISAKATVNVAPEASLGDTGGLLGAANVNVAGLIDLSNSQLFTVNDGNNNINKVVINNAALVNLDIGAHYTYSKAMAAEFGLDISVIYAVLLSPAQITIKSKNGQTIDVDRLNEFLGTVKYVSGLGQILDVKLLAGQGITVTDSDGVTGTDTTVDLADVGVLAGLGELAKLQQSGIIQEGDNGNNEQLKGDQSALSKDDRLYGYDGDDVLDAGEGSDILRGGAGNDILYAGNGNDILIGGKGDDELWGDKVGSTDRFSDVFKWEAGDQGTFAAPAKDTIKDFDKASVTEGGDVLHLAGLLVGEGRIGFSTGNLTNYLHFTLETKNGVVSTVISISSTGGYIGGYSAANASKTDQIIVLENVDLITGQNNYGQNVQYTDQQIIQDLLNKGKLVVDSANLNADALTDQTIDMSAQVTDNDGDIKNTGNSSIDTSNVPDKNFIADNVAPVTQAKIGNLLSLINLDALGLINLSHQSLTAFDANENLTKVEVKYQPIITVSLTPMQWNAQQVLADALGLKFEIKNDDGVLGLIASSSKIVITAKDGGTIDNLAINEFLASVYLSAQGGTLLTGNVLNLDVINSISISAQDSQGATSSSNVGQLLGVNLLDESLFDPSKSNIVMGTDLNDVILFGSSNSDRIYGLNGDDTIQAGAGDDLVRGGIGNDKIYGEDGNDLLLGEAGNDEIYGGIGDDYIDGGIGDDILNGGEGNDTILGGDGVDTIYGGIGNDYIDGGIGNDILNGDEGNDTIFGGDGNDTINGGAGNDIIHGGRGNDTITGGTGSDTVILDLLSNTDATGGNGLDTWKDFSLSDGDKIDISSLLTNFDPKTSNIKDFISLSNVGGTVTISLDRDGVIKNSFGQDVSTYKPAQLLILENQSTTLKLDDLLNGNHFIY